MATAALHPRAERTRRALLAAGIDLLAERPIDALAIDDIVARAGVAKGSFFNHFVDKPGFEAAIAAQIRLELESRIQADNAVNADTVDRLATGMRIGLDFALDETCKTTIMLRSPSQSTLQDHPLNKGIMADIAALVASGEGRPEAASSGVRYWLGLCQVLMLNALERRLDRPAAAARLREMLILALGGLGVGAERALQTAERQALLLLRGREA